MRSAVIAALLFVPLIARAADPMPSLEDLQKSLADKDYAGLLKGTTRILQLRGPVTASYHRTTVWSLKAEALVHSGQTSAAAAAFTSAAGEKDATDDEKDLCLASALVLKHSNGATFKLPASAANPAPQQFDITDPDHRKEAMAALLTADLADLKPAIEKIKAVLTPGPLTTAVKKLSDLLPLERATDKSTDKIDDLQKQIGENFTTAIGDWSLKTGKRLDELSALCAQVVITRYTDNKGFARTRQGPRGLMPQEQTEVRGLASDAKAFAQNEVQIESIMSPPGKAAIEKSKPIIQSTYDQTQAVLRAAALAH